MKLVYAPSNKKLEYEGVSKSELAEKLRKHICNECLTDAGLTEHHGSLSELLSTPCGCEWWVEEDEN